MTDLPRPLARRVANALTLDLIHNIDILDQLIDSATTDTAAWPWQRQLRFYLRPRDCGGRRGGGAAESAAEVVMSDARSPYSYEYQGNAPRLVYTPLTDVCYLKLTQGLHQGFVSNLYGPAGTGKTESVKALGMALGRQVLVFNCDSSLDVLSMGRIFVGLVKCGAWGCFDEFNRLDEEVLSAVSQQIQVI